MGGDEGAECLDEGHHLALVVFRATGNDFFAVGAVDDGGIKRCSVPQFKWVAGLHIIVTIIQKGLCRFVVGFALCEHNGVAVGFDDLGVKTHAVEFVDHPVGRFAHIAIIGWIGGDRGNFQPFDKAINAIVEILFDMRGDRVQIEVAHG